MMKRLTILLATATVLGGSAAATAVAGADSGSGAVAVSAAPASAPTTAAASAVTGVPAGAAPAAPAASAAPATAVAPAASKVTATATATANEVQSPWDPALPSPAPGAAAADGVGYTCWNAYGDPLPQESPTCADGWGGRPPENPLSLGDPSGGIVP